MSTLNHPITLAEILEDPSNTSVRVTLSGPSWSLDNPDAECPRLGVNVRVAHPLRVYSDSADSPGSIRTLQSDSDGSSNSDTLRQSVSSSVALDIAAHEAQITELEARNAKPFGIEFQNALTRHLQKHVATKYKVGTELSEALDGGCCVTHRKELETFLEKAMSDVARDMIWIESGGLKRGTYRPSWLMLERSGASGDRGSSRSDPAAIISDFCEYATPNGSIYDNCLAQSIVSDRKCRHPLTRSLHEGSLKLVVEAELRTLAPLFTDLRVRWANDDDSLNMEWPEIEKQLRQLDPISTAFLAEVKKKVKHMKGWRRSTHEEDSRFAIEMASAAEEPTQSLWRVPYPFLKINSELRVVD